MTVPFSTTPVAGTRFNALPSNGNCRAVVGLRIDKGHFGDVKLDGLKAAAVFAWPGAIHEGRGEGLAVIDESANAEQREALLKILSGQEAEPFATIFSVLAAMTEKFHEPQFKPVEFEADMDKRVGHVSVSGLIEAKVCRGCNEPGLGGLHRLGGVCAETVASWPSSLPIGRCRAPALWCWVDPAGHRLRSLISVEFRARATARR
jgi:hypothetical protein